MQEGPDVHGYWNADRLIPYHDAGRPAQIAIPRLIPAISFDFASITSNKALQLRQSGGSLFYNASNRRICW
jgi:hypothetical protein